MATKALPFAGPMRAILVNGSQVLIDTAAQVETLPESTVFEPTGETDPDGRLVYKEVNEAKLALALVRTLAEELEHAALALKVAAHSLKNCPGKGMAASLTFQAYTRASEAHLGLTQGQQPAQGRRTSG